MPTTDSRNCYVNIVLCVHTLQMMKRNRLRCRLTRAGVQKPCSLLQLKDVRAARVKQRTARRTLSATVSSSKRQKTDQIHCRWVVALGRRPASSYNDVSRRLVRQRTDGRTDGRKQSGVDRQLTRPLLYLKYDLFCFQQKQQSLIVQTMIPTRHWPRESHTLSIVILLSECYIEACIDRIPTISSMFYCISKCVISFYLLNDYCLIYWCSIFMLPLLCHLKRR